MTYLDTTNSHSIQRVYQLKQHNVTSELLSCIPTRLTPRSPVTGPTAPPTRRPLLVRVRFEPATSLSGRAWRRCGGGRYLLPLPPPLVVKDMVGEHLDGGVGAPPFGRPGALL